jgi:peptidoglycan-associated lipoprotein
MNRRMPTLAAAIIALPVLAGCSSAQPKAPTPGLTQPVDPPVPPSLGTEPAETEVEEITGPYNMFVTRSIRDLCTGPDPFFSFDSSKPRSDDQPTMKILVACMLSGPLRGKTIKLIGHTDPRGSPTYNEHLGLERAKKVKLFLVTNGVEPNRVQTASIGAEGAAQAPKEWPQDRRVQIQLVR